MTSSTSGQHTAAASHHAPGLAAPASVADAQLAAWMAGEYGQQSTAPAGDGDLDIEEVLGDIACVLNDHNATHLARALAIWAVPDHPEEVLITAGRPQQGQLCALPALLRRYHAAGARGVPARRPRRRRPPRRGRRRRCPAAARFVPANGTVVTYDPATVAAGSLDEAVHDVFSRQASAVNNAGPLAQLACLIGELGPAAAQQEITSPG
jgi:hypothetical protein